MSLVNNRTDLITQQVRNERVLDIQASKKFAPVLKNYEEYAELLKRDTIDRSFEHRTSVGLSDVPFAIQNMSGPDGEESFAKELDPIVYINHNMQDCIDQQNFSPSPK